MSLKDAAAALRTAAVALNIAAQALEHATEPTPATAPTAAVLADVLAVFAKAGNPPALPTAEIITRLAAEAPDLWGPAAFGIPPLPGDTGPDTGHDYLSAAGSALSRHIAEELHDTGRKVTTVRVTAGERILRGYRLADIAAAIS